MAKKTSYRVAELAGVQPDDLGTLRLKIFGAPGTDSKHVRITEAERDLILDILQDADER